MTDSETYQANVYRGLLPQGESGRGLTGTTRLHRVLRLGMVERYLHHPIRLHGAVLNLVTVTGFSQVYRCRATLFSLQSSYTSGYTARAAFTFAGTKQNKATLCKMLMPVSRGPKWAVT
jgi:hypothetical protein